MPSPSRPAKQRASKPSAGSDPQRYTLSLNRDTLSVLDHVSARTGIDRARIVRALIYHYGAGNSVGSLPLVAPVDPIAVRVLDSIKSLGLRAV